MTRYTWNRKKNRHF